MRWMTWMGARVVRVAVAALLALPVGMPSAFAARLIDHEMRPQASDESPQAQRGIGGDTAWVWGAAGQGGVALGRPNLVSAGKRIVSGAFNERRAFPLIGPGARPIDELVDAYASGHEQRYGDKLSDEAKASLRGRLTSIKSALETSLRTQTAVPLSLPRFDSVQPDRAIRFVVVLDEAGTPALVSDGVLGTPTHEALIAYGGYHAWEGWQQDYAGLVGEERVNEATPRSVYLSLDQVDGLADLGQEGRTALGQKLAHEIGDVIRGRHVDESTRVQDSVNGAISKVFDAFQQAQSERRAAYLQQRQEQARKRAQGLANRVQAVPYLMNLGRFFFADGRAPDYVIEAIEERLANTPQIKDARVKRYGEYALLEVHYNGPQRNPEVDRLVVDLVSDAVLNARRPGRKVGVVQNGRTIGELVPDVHSYTERAKALRIRTGEFSFNERGAEPIYVSLALKGGPAAYNWAVMRLLDEAVQNQLKIEGIRDEELKVLQREYDRYQQAKEQGLDALAEDLEFNLANLARQAELEGPGYVVVVEKVADILAGKRDRTAYRFVFPTHAPYIHTLVDDQTEWVITKVLPRPGSRLYDVSKAPEDQDPMLTVMVDQLGDWSQDGESFNPVFMGRQQSGAPAIGEWVSATTQFFVTTSGPGAGTEHRGVIPATEVEADEGTFAKDGLVQMVSYTYQSYDNGRIPHTEVHDQVDLSTDVKATRNEELSVHRDLMLLGSFQPAVTAPEAERRADHAVEELAQRYHEIPAVVELDEHGKQKVGPDGKPVVRLDPVLEASNKNQLLTISDLKADIGATGHQLPYQIYFAVFRASLKVAKQMGLIENFDVAQAGDDNHFVLFHKRGVDDADIHALAWYTFFRAGWVAHQLKYKLYGDMQDLVDPNVVKLIKAGQLHVYANLNDEFMQALEEEIQSLPEASRWNEIRKGYESFQEGKASGALEEYNPPGNVRGMGIGFAEKTVSSVELADSNLWTIIANDKGAAGAFNYPAYWATRTALILREHGRLSGGLTALQDELAQKMPEVPEPQRRAFAMSLLNEATSNLSEAELAALQKTIANGLVFETWDVLPNSRAFVDAESEDAQLMALLSAQNEHNIKRIWTKKRTGWLTDLTAEEVAAIEQRVEQELIGLRAEYQQRKAQLSEELKNKTKTIELINPWERAIVEREVDDLIADLRPRLVELYKVREFIGDDYIASVSTEKLAAVTGGEYVGKDDSVMIAFEPFAKLHRAITKTAVRVNIGNARGSHWVAMRPEGDRVRVPGSIIKPAVAVKWSNPIEISLRYQINSDGSVVSDAATGLAGAEDMYGKADYDAARIRVIKFNEMWIAAQGGFTPHGPNIDRDIEAAYPARKTRNKIVAENSPFAVQTQDTTLSTLAQGQLVEQFPNAADYQLNPEVAAQAANLDEPRWVVIHSSVLTKAPDAAIALERIQGQLRMALGGGQSALHFALAVDGATTPEEAEAVAQALFDALPEASRQAARLEREDFELVLPAQAGDPQQLHDLLAATVPGSILGSVVGPGNWALALKQAAADSTGVGALAFEPARSEDLVPRGAEAIIAGVETAVANGKLRQELVAKLDVSELGELWVPNQLPVDQATRAEIKHYETTIAEVIIGE